MAVTTEKISLTGVPETMLATLYGRALQSRSARPVLVDEHAERVVGRIDYDFARLAVRHNDALTIAIRARYLDAWAGQVLGEWPDATVLHLGCGLDSRVYRLAPPPTARWYDVDYPDVIALRRRLYPHRPGCHLIASSVTDPGWVSRVPADRPGLVIAEGLVQYLDADEVRTLFERLTRHLPAGVVMFDAWNSLSTRLGRRQRTIRASGARLGGWAVDDPRAVEALVPGLEFVAAQTFFDVPELDRFPWLVRASCRALKRIPAVRDSGRLLRYRFR